MAGPGRTLRLLAACAAVTASAPAAGRAQDRPPVAVPRRAAIILATTTSVYDSGLLDSILPGFESATGYRVRVVAVGSGQALRLAAAGDADIVIAHAPALEREFMAAGHGSRRRALATNYFTLIGPPDDPARVRGARDIVDALRRIAARRARFISRGDSSGTHQIELRLWRAAGVRPGGSWYREAGQGMGPTLLIADERRAYTLTDRGTLLAFGRRLDLTTLAAEEPLLRNLYHVIEVNAARRPRVNAEGGRALADWLVSPAGQDLIDAYGRERFGETLFHAARGRD